MAKAVAKKQDAEVTAWGGYEGPTGFEGTDKSELAIPFINLLQSNSEMVEADKAKAGQFFNNIMETVHDDLKIIPCAKQRVFVEWIPVDDGGGFVGLHEPTSDFVLEAIAKNGNNTRDIKVADGKHDLVETIYLYVLVHDGNDWQRAVISFSSSKLKKYRQFLMKATSQTLLVGDRKIQLPLWAHRWTLTSEEEVSKANGRKYKNLSLAFDGETAKDCRLTPDDPIFIMAQDFHDMVVNGMAKADHSTMDTTSSNVDDDIPF